MILSSQELGHTNQLQRGRGDISKMAELAEDIKMSATEIEEGVRMTDALIDAVKNRRIRISQALKRMGVLGSKYESVYPKSFLS